MSIQEFGQIGFINDVECLPKFDKFDSIKAQRSLFLNFFNSQVEKKFRFSKGELQKYKKIALKEVFINKIVTLLNVNFTPDKAKKSFYLNIELTNTISTFTKFTNLNPHTSLQKMDSSTKNIDLAYQLILLCFDGVKIHLKLDADKLFTQFVYEKIKRQNQNKKTSKCDNCIDITSSTSTTTKVITYWELLNKDNLQIKEAVSSAIEIIKTTDFNQIYLVYPKHQDFDKHIIIKSKELETCRKEYDIKVIPYSLRSILR